MVLLLVFINIVFTLSLGYYLMSALQWYSYRFERVIFHFHKPWWHFIFLICPLILYYTLKELFLPILICIYLPLIYFWYKKLDKPLKFTSRVKRFFIILITVLIFQDIVCIYFHLNFSVVLPLGLSLFLSYVYEKIIFDGFKKDALKKLNENGGLKIIAITASYGKTSIKNFLFHIVEKDFRTYKTPRSVNTLSGLVLDINESLPNDVSLYIAEAGAREKGDIKDIADLLLPHIAIVGQIGAQHLEYFKTLENIRNTKMELITSKRLQRAFIHESANVNANSDNKIVVFGKDDIAYIDDSLEGIKFGLNLNGRVEDFKTDILGAFNVTNLTVCIKVALYLGINIETIKQRVSTIKSVEHRLQRIDAGGKIIIDDSFNGNFEGMQSSYALVKKYNGRKVLITPGIVESSDEENRKLAMIIDNIFDLVIITGATNMTILDENIKKPEKILLKDKSKLTNVLATKTNIGDLILFSNDAPTHM